MSRHNDAYAWVQEHQEELSTRAKERENAAKSASVQRYTKARFSHDPAWRRMIGFRRRFTSCLLRKWCDGREPERDTQTSKKLFGCSWAEMRAHVEKQFQPGMTWENHGKGPEKWCLDHKRAICLYDWWTWEGLKEAFHWSNVQPLWGWQHRAKTDFDNALGRRRAIVDEELGRRLKPRSLPPLEGTNAEILAKLAEQLGIADQ